MKEYSAEIFKNLFELIREENEVNRKFLLQNNARELVEFWDAYEGVEASFKWLMENDNYPLAATIDAIRESDQAKAWLLTNGHREMAAFADACEGKKQAVFWLIHNNYKGWVLVAREINQKIKKKEKSIWGILNFGNPFR